MPLFIHGLNARGIVHMRNRGNLGTAHVQEIDSRAPCLLRRQPAPALLVHGSYKEHVGAVFVSADTEELVGMIAKDGGRERAKRFSELHLQVHSSLHRHVARVANNAPTSEGPRAIFHTPLEQADHLPCREQIGHRLG